MKISLEWVSDFVDLPPELDVTDLAHELTLKTVEVEDLVDLGAPLANVVVGRVIALEPIGDRGYVLASCDVGADEFVPVATRVRNLSVGAITAIALPGARLGSSGVEAAHEVVPIKIAGVVSGGVICTAADLRLQRLFPRSSGGDALDVADIGAAIGSPVRDALHWNDVVLEIDNKSLTNRPDLWGHYGIARELAAIYDRELKPLAAAVRPAQVDGVVGEVDAALCERIAVVEFSVDPGTVAPLWLRSRLARIGESTVDLCVDLSNYVMFTVGQPTHVYDADRIVLPLSVTRSGATSELEFLNGESRQLELSTPVIRDAEGPLAVAGIMGGVTSSVSANSHRFALEVATFRPEVIRRASQRLAMRTEASARFEKGLDSPRVDVAVDLFLDLLGRIAPSATATAMQDVELEPTLSGRIELDLDFLTKRIGQSLDVTEVSHTLRSLGFIVTVDGSHLQVTVPTWRSTGDVSLPHDIVEEVARIHGYDNIPVSPLSVDLKRLPQQSLRPLDRSVREQLASRAGMQEVVTYPWVGDSLLLAAGLSKDDTVRIEGAPAPDRNSLRPSLIPNLLEAIVANLRYAESLSLFEVGTVFPSGALVAYRDIFEPMPRQASMVAAALVGTDGAALFRQAKGIVEMLRRYCHLMDLQFAEGNGAPWADRSVQLTVTAGGAEVGALGLLATRCRRLVGIDNVQVACFELDLGRLSTHPSRENRYQPVPELPGADFDLSVIVSDSTRWSQIGPAVTNVSQLINRVSFIDEFRGAWVPEGQKSLTLRVTLQPTSTTLTADDIASTRADVLATLERGFNARLRE